MKKLVFAIQILPIKGHVKKGKYVSAHIHYDVLYLLVCKNEDMDKIRILESENSNVKWCDLEDTYNKEAVNFIRPINEKIVQKISAELGVTDIKVIATGGMGEVISKEVSVITKVDRKLTLDGLRIIYELNKNKK